MAEAISLPTKESICSSSFDDDPYWCLPPRFWKRVALLEGYDIYPMGQRVGLPHRKCHCSSLHVIAASTGVEGASLELVTGYAFSSGFWFRHSWVVNQPDKTLLECTPTVFEKYYGVILTKKEEQEFREILDVNGEVF